MPIKRVMGTETEYGILGADAYDVVSSFRSGNVAGHYNSCPTNESVLSGMEDHGHCEGDYAPSGIGLGNGAERSEFVQSTMFHVLPFGYSGRRSHAYSGSSIFSPSRWKGCDKMLPNGGRFYVDMGHPEYSTPECSNPVDAVIHAKAGELIVDEARQSFEQENRCKVDIFKNNTDGKGHSYGCHENYMMKRFSGDDFRRIVVPALIPFLVTRQIFTGAGKIGTETPDDSYYSLSKRYMCRPSQPWKRGLIYQLSQRADFIETEVGLQTTYMRPIVNTRDEPHSDHEKYMRLHVICGDANMSEVSEYMKLGTTALVLDLLEDGLVPDIELESPVEALHHISSDQSWKWIVGAKRGESGVATIPAVDIQRMYLSAALNYKGRDEITDDLLERWEYALDTLEQDPMELSRCIDWVIKKSLIDSYMERNGAEMGSDEVMSMALQYHNIDRDASVFYALQKAGLIDRLVSDEQIARAVSNPPEDTRAWLRGNLVGKFGVEADWAEITFRDGGKTGKLFMPDPLGHTKAEYGDFPFEAQEDFLSFAGIELSHPVLQKKARMSGRKRRGV